MVKLAWCLMNKIIFFSLIFLCGCSTQKKQKDVYGDVLQHQVTCQNTKECKLLMRESCAYGGVIHNIDNYFIVRYSCN